MIDESKDVELNKGIQSIGNSQCTICLEELQNCTVLMPCYHHFCFVCINQWYEINPSCPLCKEPIDKFIYDILSDSEFKWYSPAEGGNLFKPLTKEHERRKRIYIRKLVPIIKSENSRKNTILTHNLWENKIEAWVERELQVITDQEDVHLLLLHTKNILFKFAGNLEAPGLLNELSGYLFGYAPVFIQELLYFMGASLNMQTYDKNVIYTKPKI